MATYASIGFFRLISLFTVLLLSRQMPWPEYYRVLIAASYAHYLLAYRFGKFRLWHESGKQVPLAAAIAFTLVTAVSFGYLTGLFGVDLMYFYFSIHFVLSELFICEEATLYSASSGTFLMGVRSLYYFLIYFEISRPVSNTNPFTFFWPQFKYYNLAAIASLLAIYIWKQRSVSVKYLTSIKFELAFLAMGTACCFGFVNRLDMVSIVFYHVFFYLFFVAGGDLRRSFSDAFIGVAKFAASFLIFYLIDIRSDFLFKYSNFFGYFHITQTFAFSRYNPRWIKSLFGLVT